MASRRIEEGRKEEKKERRKVRGKDGKWGGKLKKERG